MKSKASKLTVCTLIGVMTFSVVSCGKEPTIGEKDGIEIWSKPSTVNVMQNVEYADSFKEDVAYNVIGGRGEYESSQIIITTPVGETATYTIEVSDLVCGDNKIDKSYIDVYNEKYINVKSSNAEFTTGTGWYADALIPFAKAVEYGENVVGNNEELRNQGLYVETFIPREAPAGEYKGTFELTVGDKTHTIPACVTVCDFDVSQESHLEMDWISKYYGFAEMDTTNQNLKNYFEAIASYRASTHNMEMGDANVEEWIQGVRKYTNPNLRDENGKPLIGEKESYLAAINIPSSYDSTTGIDRNKFDKYFSKLVYWSIKDEYDYLSKVGCYPGYIDEPQLNNTWDNVKKACDGWNTYKNKWATEIIEAEAISVINEKANVSDADALTQENFDALSEEFKQQLVQSTRLIGYYVTTNPDDRLDNTATTQFCYYTGNVASEEEYYRLENWTDVENDGNWAYAAGNGQFGNRIDSEPLEQRLLSWYMNEKNLTGFLIWEVSLFQEMSWDSTARKSVYKACDAYSVAQKISNGAGDGYLFYPGAAYGLDGPVGSIRAHQYREASEEYEYFYLLNDLYERQGYSADAVLDKLCASLYNEKTITNDTEIFAKQRQEVINLIAMAKKGVFFTDYTERNAQATLSVVSVGDENIVEVNGKSVTPCKEVKAIRNTLTETGNVSVKTDGGMEFIVYLPGKATLVKDTDTSTMTVLGGTVTPEKIDGLDLVSFDFVIDESLPENKRICEFSFAMDKTKISSDTYYLIGDFHNTGTSDVLVEMWFVGKEGRTVYVDDVVVKAGENASMETTRLDVVKWGVLRTFEGVKYRVSSLEGETEFSVSFGGLYAIK